MRNEIPEGYELVVGHSKEKAREAIALAEQYGHPSEAVLRSPSGYLVPGEAGLPEPVEPFANVDEVRAARAAAEAEDSEDSEDSEDEVVVPDPDKASHADLDKFAEDNGLTYDGITAENVDKPTKAEKAAHLTAALAAKNEGE